VRLRDLLSVGAEPAVSAQDGARSGQTGCIGSAKWAKPNLWSVEVMSDRLANGRPFRTLNLLDDSNREGFTVEVGISRPSECVVRYLTQIIGVASLRIFVSEMACKIAVQR